MSLHNDPAYNTREILAALKKHGLKTDAPSQLADSFRTGFIAARQGFKTADGKVVAPGEKVWVRGSCGVHETSVAVPVTNYEFFGPIPVCQSYTTRTAAEKGGSV